MRLIKFSYEKSNYSESIPAEIFYYRFLFSVNFIKVFFLATKMSILRSHMDVKNQKYDHQRIESKWQKKWQEAKLDKTNIEKAPKPFYNLMMFPYPSAEGLHVGNMYAFTGSDIFGRFKRMQGHNVFEPIGLDGFGIHSENFALKIGKNPMDQAKVSEKNYYRQLGVIGAMFDWGRTVETYDPNYYKWTQWIFVQMFKHGLAYRGKAEVNWCPSCKTVLADEQVIEGKCERCGNIVEKRLLEQWFFRITAYAEKLLQNTNTLNWSEKVLVAQRNWIGKSEGMIVVFKTTDGKDLPVFTTRPDTLNAVTFLATSKLYEKGSVGKTGKFSGTHATDPLSGRKLPIWDTNYVAPGYGTGTIMGVPAHDERDMEFAKKYHIDIVNKPPDKSLWKTVPEKGWGKKQTNYHLRDWLISRQRYWGPPIPMIFCEKCAKDGKGERKDMQGWYSVPEKDLPLELPYIKDYKPGDDGIAPLAKHKEFYEVNCPGCGNKARRETDVSDTFLDSAWYFLRYPSVGLDGKSSLLRAPKGDASRSDIAVGGLPWNPAITKKWLPVDMYTGGAEHSVLHLMYSRFITMALHDWGYLDFDEPFPNFYAHGLVIKDGAKMSKSKGNVVTPDEYIKLYGTDALRLYLMFMGPFDLGGDFRDSAMEGMSRWVNRIWRLRTVQTSNEQMQRALHKLVKKVTEDTEKRRYNTAIAAMMEFTNLVSDQNGNLSLDLLKIFLLLLAPYAPHIAEELWEKNRGAFSIHQQPWPTFDSKYIKEDQITIIIQVNGKLRDTLQLQADTGKEKSEIEKLAKENEKIKKYLEGQTVKKIIFVPGKLMNFVV